MADVLDVANALVSIVNAAVAPLVGTTYTPSGSVDAAVVGPQTCPQILVFPGSILLRDIMTRLEAGKAQIGVEFDEKYADAPQYLTQDYYDYANVPVPQIAVSVVGNVATLSGAIQVGDVIGLQLGSIGAGYAIQASDTLLSIAVNLAAAATAAGILAGASGATIVLGSHQTAQFNVGTTYTRNLEVWRRRKPFYVTLWAANVYDRSFIGKVMETSIPPATRFTLPDNSIATVLYCGAGFDTQERDDQQRDMTLIRRMRVLVDFISTQQISATQIVATTESLTALPPGSVPANTPTTALQL